MIAKLEKIIRHLLILFHINLTEEIQNSLIQFIKFGIVGVTNTIISYCLNILVLKALNPLHVSWDFIAGNTIAFILSVLWSFCWNNRFVFSTKEGQKRNLWEVLLKTYVSYAFTGILLNNVLSWIWISVLHISKYVAPLINLIISVPINFVLNKRWAFKH